MAETQQDSFNLNGMPLDTVQEESSLGDMIDIKEEVSNINAEQNIIDDSLDLASDIIKAGGMNQSIATEAIKLMPESFTSPVGYYSKITSATKYRESLESIFTTIFDKIKSICEYIRKAVRRFIDWIKGLFTKKENEDDLINVMTAAETTNEHNLKDIERAFSQIHNKNFDESLTYIDGKSTVLSVEDNSSKITIDYIVKQQLDNEDSRLAQLLKPDPVSHDVLSTGMYYKTVQKNKDTAKKITSFIKSINDKLSKLIIIAKHIGDNKDVSDSDIESIANESDTAIVFKEASDAIQSAYVQASNTQAEEYTDIDKYTSMFSSSAKSIKISETLNYMFDSSDELNKFTDELEKAEKEIESLQIKLNLEDSTEVKSKLSKLASVVRTLQMEVLACLSYNKEIIRFAMTMRNLFNRMKSINEELSKSIQSEVRKTYGSVPAEVTKLCADLTEQ